MTTIATWGNSEAVRIPRAVLRQAGLRSGDEVSVRVGEGGCIEIVPSRAAHRRVAPERGVTFDTLFPGFDPKTSTAYRGQAWPDDDLVGAEWDAWAR